MDAKTAKGVTTTDVPTLKKLWDKKEQDKKVKEEEQKKKLPKGVGLARKMKALKILKEVGLSKKAEVPKEIYDALKVAEDALKALWTVLGASGDPMTSVEQQREIEQLLQKFSQWHTEFTGN